MTREIQHFIDGKAFKGKSGQFGDIFNPNTGEVQARVQFATRDEVADAVAGAKKGQAIWAAMNPQRRARVLMKYKMMVEDQMEELAHLLSSEHGKVIADAKGDLIRGLEVIEFACGVPHLMKGEYTESAGPGIDVYSMRQPLGVVAGITPFNFPAMIPMWFMGMALSTGNAMILKPSEKDPSVPVRLAEIMIEAGLPEGVLQVVHGDKTAVDALIEHDDIKAVSFVGSSNIAHYIAQGCTRHAKRFQAMGGAKNHGIIMPDADMDQVVNDFLGAAYGSAGERCMNSSRASRRKPSICALVSRPTTPPTTVPLSPQHTARRSKTISRWVSMKAPSSCSTVGASNCRAMRRASSSARPCSTM